MGATNPVTFAIINNIGASVQVQAFLIGSATLSRSGGSSASASSGQGGWQITDRTRRKASTEWLDYYPFVQTMTCLLDGGNGLAPASIELACALLESMEVPTAGSNPALPPIVQVAGPVMHTDINWVCSRLSFDGGEAGQIRNAAGLRTQQHFTIELTEYSPTAAIFAVDSPAQAATIAAGTNAGQTVLIPSGQTYIVKPGDTLQSIAANTLGNFSLWIQIALLNGLSNSALLTPGLVLQLPAP